MFGCCSSPARNLPEGRSKIHLICSSLFAVCYICFHVYVIMYIYNFLCESWFPIFLNKIFLFQSLSVLLNFPSPGISLFPRRAWFSDLHCPTGIYTICLLFKCQDCQPCHWLSWDSSPQTESHETKFPVGSVSLRTLIQQHSKSPGVYQSFSKSPMDILSPIISF